MTTIELHGPIDEASVRAVLAQWPGRGPITIEINSPGGDVMAGWSIISKIRNHGSPVTARIVGFALSMAANIAAACHRVEAVANAVVMIHDPHMVVAGNAAAMRRNADMLEKTATLLVDVLAKKTSKSAEALAPILAMESWMDANEAKAFGLVDDILPAAPRMAASFDLSKFSPPPKIAAHLREASMTTASQNTPKPEAAAPPINPDPKLVGEAISHVMNAAKLAIGCGIPAERVFATATKMAANGSEPQAINNSLINMMAAFQDANPVDPHLPVSGYGMPFSGVGSSSYADPQFRVKAAGEALFCRIDASHKPSEAARQFYGKSIAEVARDLLQASGHRVSGMSSASVVAGSAKTARFTLARLGPKVASSTSWRRTHGFSRSLGKRCRTTTWAVSPT
jgi:ATP-dependent Clp endopeptidase proteolytic subunit ClpP